ncbi:ABC transporter ATP-binding protein [Candidatus Bipolaricaulota bacterium]|nr:ABC transporter ATP-binding protein [Candidatus Bipolaricaulota bacterium]
MVVADIAVPFLTQRIIDLGIARGNFHVIWTTALIMLGAALCSALFAIINNALSVRVGQGFAHDVRDSLVRKAQSFSFGNLDRIQTGQLLTRTTSDVNNVQMIVQMALRILTRAPLWMVGAVVMLIITSPRLALLLFAFVPVIVLLVFLFGKRAGKLYLWVQQRLERLNTVLQENLAGVRVVKAFVRERHEEDRFEAANVDLTHRNTQAMRLVAFIMPTMILVMNAAVIGVLWYGGTASAAGDLTVGKIVASVNYLSFALFPLMMLAMMLSPISAASASAGRIFEVLDSDPDVSDRPAARSLSRPKGKISFENVMFSYSGDPDSAVLKDITFSAEPGETVAILGATGSGKTSLIHLIPRFYDVTDGRVLFDGIDVRDLKLQSLRAQVGIALQEAVLFGGTIRDNIRFGVPSATQSDVVEAAKAAQAEEFIDQLPDGYDTAIGQRGVTLSGGQRQRLAIARALLVRPKVLILDDSTSAVDIETEVRLQDALDQLLASSADSTTRFIVAQRISTVLLADKILVLDRGEVAAIGTHGQLLAESQIYQDIYRSQLGAPDIRGGQGGADV